MKPGTVTGKRQVVIRTDASIQIGSGHVMRGLTLADALQELSITYMLRRSTTGY